MLSSSTLVCISVAAVHPTCFPLHMQEAVYCEHPSLSLWCAAPIFFSSLPVAPALLTPNNRDEMVQELRQQKAALFETTQQLKLAAGKAASCFLSLISFSLRHCQYGCRCGQHSSTKEWWTHQASGWIRCRSTTIRRLRYTLTIQLPTLSSTHTHECEGAIKIW